MSGAVPAPLPLGPLVLLRMAMWFTGLIGGTAARTATVVRFYQRRGLAPIVAVSSGLIYSVGGFCVQVVLSVTALIFTGDEFHLEPAGSAGSGAEVLQLVLYAIVAAGLVGGIAFHVPKVRRLAAARLQPRLAPAWRNVRNLLNDPGQLGRLLAGAAVTQLLLATGLWFALHAVGASASFGSLIIVCTASSLLGGIAPVPGGMGVVEASYISLLTLLGIPEDLAIATTLLYRIIFGGLSREEIPGLPKLAVPGLSDLPVVGRLFAHNRKETTQTDVVLTLTPHIIRVLDLNEADLRAFRVGRDSVPPLSDLPLPIDIPRPADAPNPAAPPADAPPPIVLPPSIPTPAPGTQSPPQPAPSIPPPSPRLPG